MELEQEDRRGREAQLLLENPLLIESFDLIELELKTKWQDSPAGEAESRERIWVMLKLLQRVKYQLESVALTGKLARKTIRERLGPNVSPL